ncbi:MAG: DUF6893 family small protein [Candidatus Binatia bacterium]
MAVLLTSGRKHSAVGHPPNSNNMLKLIGGAFVALFALGIIANFKDIKRYIRMSTM